MVSYLYQMPSGIPGTVTRPEFKVIEAAILNQTTPPTSFGVAVKNVSGTLEPISSSSDVIVGVLVRPYPTSGNGTDGLGTSTPNKAFPADLLKKGYINVLLNNYASVPCTKQSPVYVRVANASTGKVIGNFEAAPEFAITGTAGTNTGNGTIGSLGASQVPGIITPPGTYTVTFTGATNYNVSDASGAIIATGAAASSSPVAFLADNGLTGKLTKGGTAFVSGDTFSIVVTANTILVPGNTYFTGGVDGSGNAEVAFYI